MNPFVNLNKRSILLPSGCKDLIDTFPLRKRRTVVELNVTGQWEPVIKPDRFETEGLLHVRGFIEKLIASPAPQASGHIRSLDGQSGVSFWRAAQLTLCPLHENSERLERIIQFFSSRGIQPSRDEMMGIGPSGLPVRILEVSLARDVIAAAQLTVDLLREVYDLDDESGLEFMFVEVKAAWPG